jgi:hypothetical protein
LCCWYLDESIVAAGRKPASKRIEQGEVDMMLELIAKDPKMTWDRITTAINDRFGNNRSFNSFYGKFRELQRQSNGTVSMPNDSSIDDK